MITQVEVSGFRSLDNFKMHLTPGLNVLVGPNGSGKTNIVLFFEFLAHLVESDLSEATSFLGGSGAILRRENETHSATLSARVLGCYSFEQDSESPFKIDPKLIDNNKFGFYEYSFTVMFTRDLEPVVFLKQNLNLKLVGKFVDHARNEAEASDWDLELEAMSVPNSNRPPELTVKRFRKNMEIFLPFFRGNKESEQIQQLKQFIGGMVSSNNALPNIITRFSPMMHHLAQDIAGGQAFNIVPSKVRMPEDSARPPGIAHDGSGLASTLYTLKRRNAAANAYLLFQNLNPGRLAGIRTQPLDLLVSYFKLANKSVQGIDISLDTFSNQVRVTFDVKNGDYSAKIPLALMSDGTLKWLTLITAALTSTSVFSIEEPENYLHPNMQAECVNILRDILFQKKPYGASLLTTHSETLLNHCKPSELIIVNFVDGRTIAYRCHNEAEVSDEIAKTGFGLGYFYITNALHHE